MNDIYARKLSQTTLFQQLYRTHGSMWQATRATKEKLDYKFVSEEMMRVNGQRTMPLLIGGSADYNIHNAHWNEFMDGGAWKESMRAYMVKNQSTITRKAAAMGRMAETTPNTKTGIITQTSFMEHVGRVEGTNSCEEEPFK